MTGALLADLLRLSAAHPEPDALLPRALAHVRTATGATACAVWTHDGDAARRRGTRRWFAGEAEGAEREAATHALRGERTTAPAAAAWPLRHAEDAAPVAALVVVPAPADADAASWQTVADLFALLVAQSERAAASAATVEEDRRLVETLVDSLPLGVYVVDRDYRVRLWNRKRELGTLGVTREEALGQTIFEVLPRQDAALMRREFDEVFETGQLQQLQIESHTTGERRAYRLTKIPMRVDPDGPVTHVVTLGEDVTDWKGAVERTAQAEKLAAIGQLAAGVMHEINNPLATVAACAETMTLSLADLPRDHKAPPGFAEYLRIIDHEVHRCKRIIDGLLNFSRARPVQRLPLGVNTVVEQTLFLLKHHTRFKRCPLRLDLLEGEGPMVQADADQITQVVMALLLNAADAVSEVARGDDDEQAGITLRTRATGDGAAIEVSDDGPGIARDALSKIFEPFYTTKAPGAGTGLGLAISYGIVRDHGGRLEVESTPGQGATFRIVLPPVVPTARPAPALAG